MEAVKTTVNGCIFLGDMLAGESYGNLHLSYKYCSTTALEKVSGPYCLSEIMLYVPLPNMHLKLYL